MVDPTCLLIEGCHNLRTHSCRRYIPLQLDVYRPPRGRSSKRKCTVSYNFAPEVSVARMNGRLPAHLKLIGLPSRRCIQVVADLRVLRQGLSRYAVGLFAFNLEKACQRGSVCFRKEDLQRTESRSSSLRCNVEEAQRKQRSLLPL